jgi:1-acyl-sn-glycerol-3-phosphate acyltransferase
VLIGEPGHTPGVWVQHRALRRLVDAVAWVTWREVAIDDLDATESGPVLLVANHFGGVSDAIVLMSVLPRRPRILADDAIWKVPVARQVMQWIGAIPVHRGHSGSTDNTDMFAAAHDALAAGELVLIFPEGITREEPSIGRVRSGAARIAIGARAAGVRNIRIVPAGLHYEDKAAFRSVVYVREGQPIDLDDEIARDELVRGALAGGEEVSDDVAAADADAEHDEVEHLTALISARLRDTAPDYDDWREARALQMAAEVFLRSLEPDEPVPVGLRDRLAAWLDDLDDPEPIVDVADAYRSALSQVGATDEWAAHGRARLNRRRLFTAATWLLMVPYALMGLVAWAVPSAVTWAVSKARLAPAVMATVLPIVALLCFGLTTSAWLWVGWARDRSTGVVTAMIVLPITFAAMGLVVERGLLWVRWLRNRLTTFGGRGRHLADLRASVVAAVAGVVTAELSADVAALGPATAGPDLTPTAPAAEAATVEAPRSVAEGGT